MTVAGIAKARRRQAVAGLVRRTAQGLFTQIPKYTQNALPQRSESASNVTRLLCAGTHLDQRFASQVIEELVEQRHRFVAPAFGYDAVAVLGHALAAQRRRRWRNAGLVAALLPLPLLDRPEPWLKVTGLLLAIWCAWTTIFIDRLYCIRMLLALKHRGTDRAGRVFYHWPIPDSPVLTAEADRIATQQQAIGVYYSGFVPFVGAGALTRSWSFAVLLNGQPTPSLPIPTDTRLPRQTPDQRPRHFTEDDIAGYVQAKLWKVLHEETSPEQRIRGLQIFRRWYSRALAETPPPPLIDPRSASSEAPSNENYSSAREYLCVTIGSWGNELVTSIFIGFTVHGNTLHTELHSYVLPPVKATFHEVDRLPTRPSLLDLMGIAVSAPFRLLREIAEPWITLRDIRRSRPAVEPRGPNRFYHTLVGFSAFCVLLTIAPCLLCECGMLQAATGGLGTQLATSLFWIVGCILARKPVRRFLATRRAPTKTDEADHRQRTGFDRESHRLVDFGARTSIRDLATAEGMHHFFQATDQDKYTKIIERRVMEVIVDFLEEHNIDTSEYRSRQAAVLNIGIMQTGAGQIVNAGPISAGAVTSHQ